MADVTRIELEVRLQGAENIRSGMRGMGEDARGVAGAVDAVSERLKALALAAAAVAGVASLGGLVKDTTLLAARYETLAVVMETAGKTAGYNAAQMHTFERSLVDAGISMTEARGQLARLAAAQIDLAESSRLARVAQDLAVVGGINSSEAFQRMTHGIVSAEVEILRTLGLNVTFEQSYKSLATQLGKNTDQLTEQEKIQARVNIVLQQGARYAGIYEASMATAGKQLTSLPRYFEDIKVMAGEVGLPAFAHGLGLVTEAARGTRQALMDMRASGELEGMGAGLGAGFAEAVGYVDNLAVAVAAYIAVQKGSAAVTAAAAAASNSYAGAIARGEVVVLGSAAAERMRAQHLVQTAEAEHVAAVAALEAAQAEKMAAQARYNNATSARQASQALGGLQAGNHALHLAQQRLIVSTNQLSAAQRAFAGTSGWAAAMSRIKDTAKEAAVSGLNVLKSAGAGLVSFLGGPWSAALIAASVGLYAIWEKGRQAEERAASVTREFEAMHPAAKKAAEGVGLVEGHLERMARRELSFKVDDARAKLALVDADVNQVLASVFAMDDSFISQFSSSDVKKSSRNTQ